MNELAPAPTLPCPNLRKLKGYLRPAEGDRLAYLAALVPADQAIVEIGSYLGKSTVYMATVAEAPVYAVDPWDLGGQEHADRIPYAEPTTFDTFRQQIRQFGVSSKVTACKAYSVEMAAAWSGRRIGLLFIDGEHTYEAVTADIAAWLPHMARRGWVAFHDYDPKKNPGVVQAVDEWLPASGGVEFTIVERVVAVRLP